MTLKEITQAMLNLRPGAQWSLTGTDLNNLSWDDIEQSRPTDDEIVAEIERLQQQAPLDSCKAKAKELLAETDWAALPDVNLANKQDFETYRSQVRALMINPIADPVWPVKPEAVWS